MSALAEPVRDDGRSQMRAARVDADADEFGRLAALRRYNILDTPAEPAFDKITRLVQQVLGVPIAAVSLVDADRQWFKSRRGLVVSETPRSMAFCDHTIRHDAPFVVTDAASDPRFHANPLVAGAPYIGSYAGVPLMTPDGYRIGALCAIDRKPREFSAEQLGILIGFAAVVADELELRQIARQDHLTGVLSRGGFAHRAEAAIAAFAACGPPAALALFDLDHFKQVNDRFGHAAGDAALRSVAQACSAMLRDDDCIGRMGGEEFAILLSGPAAGAYAAAERFRTLIEALPAGITASFGVAPLQADYICFDTWLAAADAPLYEAKRAGRNRCRISGA